MRQVIQRIALAFSLIIKVVVLNAMVTPCLSWQGETAVSSEQQMAKGIVFVDSNHDGKLDADEQRISGVRISNGQSIVMTNPQGEYNIPVSDDQIVFVIKTRGFRTALSEDNLPRFYYIHKPAGSPKLRFSGVAATGPLPSSINFPLYPQNEPENFKAILFGDPQPRNLTEVGYIAEDVIPEVIGTDASMGVTLGDIVFDDLSCFTAVNETYGLLGIPWYNIIGNHDINLDVKQRKYANETFENTYGPSYYSFDYGNVHFIAADNINYHVDPTDGRSKYNAKFGQQQLEFIKNDLALVPANSLVVILMHIPLTGTIDRQELYRLIEKRPFCLSISGHTHYHANKFIDQTDGWNGDQPHHHIINVTVSGSWWGGNPDERGIPHTMMKDGAPNGYSIISFDNTNYQLDFYAAGRPKSYQMNIVFPDEVATNKMVATDLIANVFNATSQDKVEARVGWEGDWHPLVNYNGVSPLYQEVAQRELLPDGRPMLGAPNETEHLWKLPLGDLVANAAVGHHLVQVRWTDRTGRTTVSNRVLRVVESKEVSSTTETPK